MLRDAESESESQDAGALAEDNKRLQDMLHAALRREAEALRRVKHLSELLSECRVNCGTPSSGPERRARATLSPTCVCVCLCVFCDVVAEGVGLDGRRLDWEVKPVWETTETWDSVPHSQVSLLCLA